MTIMKNDLSGAQLSWWHVVRRSSKTCFGEYTPGLAREVEIRGADMEVGGIREKKEGCRTKL